MDEVCNSPRESTALHICASFGIAEIAKAVINSISDPNVNLIIVDDAPLTLAARHGHVEIIRLLLDRDDTSADIHGFTNTHRYHVPL